MRNHDAGGRRARREGADLTEIMISILLQWLLSLYSLVLGSEETSLRHVDALQEERKEKEKCMKVD